MKIKVEEQCIDHGDLKRNVKETYSNTNGKYVLKSSEEVPYFENGRIDVRLVPCGDYCGTAKLVANINVEADMKAMEDFIQGTLGGKIRWE